MSRPATPAGGRVMPQYNSGISHVDHARSDTPDASYVSGALLDNDSARGGSAALQRSNSQMSQPATYLPSRGGTLKKKGLLQKNSSLRRSGSRKSSYAGSVRSLRLGDKDEHQPEEYNSVFYCPIPIVGSPTELLAERFQAWRKVLKDIIAYFKDIHKANDLKSRALVSASNIINNSVVPRDFLENGGVGDAATILRDFQKKAVHESQKARDLENEVILQLTGLRSDLSQKIKEIKSLSGDFKNSVAKEQDATKRAIDAFTEATDLVDRDAGASAGRGDPFLQKLAVEKQVNQQIEEENYLHRAYLNLEASGRELESIVVGEIQKAYNVLHGILKREADDGYECAERLRAGPLAMKKDHEWDNFVTGNQHMVDPRQPLRRTQQILWPGKNHTAALEVRNGMLERKSKYLKNYTPGWYILSPTHLHEFKSADRIAFQQPVMSLYLPDQKLGSHSERGSSSHKFMLKGRQTGSMHRGHTWIFRAESYDTMMAWFSDLKELTEKTGEARNEFVRRTHARSVSAGSNRAPSVSSGASQMEEDEADKIAFSSEQSVRGIHLDGDNEDSIYNQGVVEAGVTAGTAAALANDGRSEAGWRPPQQRPLPGGRFPSEVNVNRGLRPSLSPSSGDSGDEADRDALAQAGALPGSGIPFAGVSALAYDTGSTQQQQLQPAISPNEDDLAGGVSTRYTAGEHQFVAPQATGAEVVHDSRSQYREWVGTMEAGVGSVAAGAVGAYAYSQYEQSHPTPSEQPKAENSAQQMESAYAAIPAQGYSSVPMVATAVAPIEPVVESQVLPHSLHEAITIPRDMDVAPTTVRAIPVTKDVDVPVTKETDITTTSGALITGTDIRVPSTTVYAEPALMPQSRELQTAITVASPEPQSMKAAPVPVPVSAPGPAIIPAAIPTPSAATKGEDSIMGKSTKPPTRPAPVSQNTISDLHIPGEFPRVDANGIVRDSGMFN